MYGVDVSSHSGPHDDDDFMDVDDDPDYSSENIEKSPKVIESHTCIQLYPHECYCLCKVNGLFCAEIECEVHLYNHRQEVYFCTLKPYCFVY